jgi:hypothetical protein
MWRMGDMLREFRGDSHTASWISAGFDATEIGMLSELYWGLPLRSYSRTRAWTNDDFDAAEDRLRSRGLLEGEGMSAAGRTAREAVETDTDAQMQPVLDVLGDDLDELCAIMAPWGATVRAGGGYLQSGPHDLGGR